jgi:hypothetical protein
MQKLTQSVTLSSNHFDPIFKRKNEESSCVSILFYPCFNILKFQKEKKIGAK